MVVSVVEGVTVTFGACVVMVEVAGEGVAVTVGICEVVAVVLKVVFGAPVGIVHTTFAAKSHVDK